jgi:cell wall-associated NlpC family hydrolase
MKELDPRIYAYREDLAAAYLQDKVRAAKYVQGEDRQVVAPSIALRSAPRFDATVVTEALMGEIVTMYEVREGWAWVQLRDDRYVGYTTVDGLSALPEESTHRVIARLTHLYPAPDMKRPPITKLSFSCTVALSGRAEGRFVELSRGGFVFADHLLGIREKAKDYVRVAERFVGVPYLWGGKTSLGIDCSGLVQISLQAAGAACPRDSDMQMEYAGQPVEPMDIEKIQRGDLLFWQGHVAIAQSPDWLVHASGHHMEVVVEPIQRALERIGEAYGPLLLIRRPSFEAPAQALPGGAPMPVKQLEERKGAQPAAPAPQAARPAPQPAGTQSPRGAPQQVPPPANMAPSPQQPAPAPAPAPAQARAAAAVGGAPAQHQEQRQGPSPEGQSRQAPPAPAPQPVGNNPTPRPPEKPAA